MAERRRVIRESKQPVHRAEPLRPSWHEHLLPLEVDYPNGYLLTALQEHKYLVVDVVLDSGAGMHVINPSMVDGWTISESELSRMGAGFIAANGHRLKNYGEVELSILTPDSNGQEHAIKSKFEVTDVTRPLWSVGLICDSGLDVKFSKTKATVNTKEGKELCVFHRVPGLYIAKAKIKNPKHEDFCRQGS